jgi:hypothetical protein
MQFVRIFFLISALTQISSAFGDEIHNLYDGVRERAMGGASTAITEGDEAIYLNPAAMAGNKRAVFYALNADVSLSSDTITTFESSSTAFSNINDAAINSLMGKDIEGRATLSPAITLPNFGVSFLIDQQFALLAHNQANPQVLLGYQTTNGIQFATGFTVIGNNKNSKDELRIGAGYKIMFRRGGYYDLTLDQILNINENEVKNVIGSFGTGMDGDFGLQYIRKISKTTQLLAGLDYQDIGGMTFSGGGQTQAENLAIGIGAKFMLGRAANMTIGYDIKNLTQDVQFEKRQHFGIELALPLVAFDLGLNEGAYISYGASVDLWLLKISALSYEEELGTDVGQEGERNYMLRITIKFDI